MNSKFRKIIAYVLVFAMAMTMNVNVFATTVVVTQIEPTTVNEEAHEHYDEDECLSENGTDIECDVKLLSDDIRANGTCGDSVTWFLDSEGTLTISGTGAMYDYGTEEYFLDPVLVPWNEYKGEITKIIINEGITHIGSCAFYNMKVIDGNVEIPGGVKTIGSFAFGESGISGELTIPSGVTRIENRAFENCEQLKGDLALPDTVEYIGVSAFSGCGFDGQLTISQSLTEILEKTFHGCKFTDELVLPDSITYIGYGAFADCSEFTGELVLPASLKQIDGQAFLNCSGFAGNLVIPEKLTSIGASFTGCSGLTGTVDIPETVTSFAVSAFNDTQISKIRIFNRECSVGGRWSETIDVYGYADSTADKLATKELIPFYYLDQKEEEGILVSGTCGDELVWSIDENGELMISGTGEMYDYNYSNNPAPWLRYELIFKTLVINEGVTKIGKDAFIYCRDLTSANGDLIIPEGVEYIGAYAFADCDGFDGELHLPDSLVTLKDSVFEECTNLSGTLNLPENLKTTGWYAFAALRNITGTVVIPSSLTKVSPYIFEGSSGIENIVIHENVTSVGEGALFIKKTDATPLNVYVLNDALTFDAISNYSSAPINVYGHESAAIQEQSEGCSYVTFEVISEDNCIHPEEYNVELEAAAPTCTESGLTKGVGCDICGIVVSGQDVIPETGHSYNKVVTVPTCGAKGYTTYACACGHSYKTDETATLGHKWDAGKVTTEATCTASGEKTYICQNDSNHTKTEVIKAPGHDIITTPGKAPTCTEAGYTEEQYCKRCGEFFCAQKHIAATGHSYGEWINITAPTCTNDGVKERTCINCGDKETETIKALAHDIVRTAGKAPTCTEPGCTNEEMCKTCGKVFVPLQSIPATGHKYGNWIVGKTSTCTEPGYRYKDCSVCGSRWVDANEIPATGHEYDGGVVTTHPTDKTPGVKTFTCKGCGQTYSESIPVIKPEITVIASGTCGYEAVWTLTSDDLLQISGKGVIEDRTGFIVYDSIIEKVVIEEGITGIYPQIFENMNMRSVVLPNSLEEVGFAVFANCNNLVMSGTLPSNMKTIEDHAFNFVDFNSSLVLPEGLETIGLGAFASCVVNGDIKIPASVKSIGSFAFSFTPGIECVYIYNKKCQFPDAEIVTKDSTLVVGKGSTGEAYAEKMGYKYKYFDGGSGTEHEHDLINDAGKSPTCIEAGWEPYVKCKDCDYTTYKEIPATGHNYGDWVLSKGASCDKGGTKTKTCNVCGDVVKGELPKTGHKKVAIPAVAPTCTATGLTKGQKCSECDKILVKQQVVEKIPHVTEVLEGYAATCMAAGLTNGRVCIDCGTVTVAQKTIPKLPHNTEIIKGYDSTCIATGLTDAKACIDCGEVTVEHKEIAAKGHKKLGYISENIVEPELQEDGTFKPGSQDKVYYCISCDLEVDRETVPIYKESIKIENSQIDALARIEVKSEVTSVPETIKGTVNEVKDQLKDAALNKDETARAEEKVDVVFMDIEFKVQKADGTWNDVADVEDVELPKAGVEIILPYPADIEDPENYEFVIAHMITADREDGMKAGDIEYLEPVKTPEGLKVTVKSFSPFAIVYHEHTPEDVVKAATVGKKGAVESTCTVCGEVLASTDIAAVVKTAVVAKVFTGKTLTQTVNVKDKSGNVINSVKLTGKNVGTYKKTVKLSGNYSGSVTVSFKINPKGTTLGKLTAAKKALTVKWRKPKAAFLKQTTGYQIRYSTKASMAGAKTKLVTKAGTTSLKLTGLKAKAKYYVQIRTYKTINGVKYYSAWSAKKSLKTK